MNLVAHCVGLLCLMLVAATARAEPDEADRATARALALEGSEAMKKKDYATAADRFNRADLLVHATTLVVDWARALQRLGRWVDAHEKYELVLREGVDGSAPKSWLQAVEDAKKELDALKPHLAWITVTLKGPTDVVVKINGVVVPPAAIGVKRAADPGAPEVTAHALGYEAFTKTLPVGPGEEKSLEITLKKLPETAAPIPASTDVHRPRQKSDTRRVMTYVAFGVGGAGLVAGGVTGVLVLRKRSDLKSECVEAFCRSSSQSTIDAYHTYGTISAAALAVGVAGIGTGIILLVTKPKPVTVGRAGFAVQPMIGLGMVGAEGAFQ